MADTFLSVINYNRWLVEFIGLLSSTKMKPNNNKSVLFTGGLTFRSCFPIADSFTFAFFLCATFAFWLLFFLRNGNRSCSCTRCVLVDLLLTFQLKLNDIH